MSTPDVDAIQLVWMVSAFGNQKSTYSRIPFSPSTGCLRQPVEGVMGHYLWLPNLLTIDARSNGVVKSRHKKSIASSFSAVLNPLNIASIDMFCPPKVL